jgi:riboflavin kinase/FMN adenylyltransferase
VKGMNQGKRLGFPTANIAVSGLCLPPLGVYAVKVIHQEEYLYGVANLGIAPTMRHDNLPLLEVYLFMEQKEIYHQNLEVIFEQFIRPEIFFDNLEELKVQVQHDIKKAQEILKKGL